MREVCVQIICKAYARATLWSMASYPSAFRTTPPKLCANIALPLDSLDVSRFWPPYTLSASTISFAC